MTILIAPVGTLADHVVTLRLPSPDAGDVATVDNYVQEEQLDGGWQPVTTATASPCSTSTCTRWPATTA